jgi:3-(3-hydroxy-phenyl)propionate hydroxylase
VVVPGRAAAGDPTGSRSICRQRDVRTSAGAGAITGGGLTWTTARTFPRDREPSRWSFTARSASPLPPFANISQARTEETLGALADVGVRWAHEVDGLSEDATGTARTAPWPAPPT